MHKQMLLYKQTAKLNIHLSVIGLLTLCDRMLHCTEHDPRIFTVIYDSITKTALQFRKD